MSLPVLVRSQGPFFSFFFNNTWVTTKPAVGWKKFSTHAECFCVSALVLVCLCYKRGWFVLHANKSPANRLCDYICGLKSGNFQIVFFVSPTENNMLQMTLTRFSLSSLLPVGYISQSQFQESLDTGLHFFFPKTRLDRIQRDEHRFRILQLTLLFLDRYPCYPLLACSPTARRPAAICARTPASILCVTVWMCHCIVWAAAVFLMRMYGPRCTLPSGCRAAGMQRISLTVPSPSSSQRCLLPSVIPLHNSPPSFSTFLVSSFIRWLGIFFFFLSFTLTCFSTPFCALTHSPRQVWHHPAVPWEFVHVG